MSPIPNHDTRDTVLAAMCGWSAAILVFSAPVSRSLYILSGLIFVLCWFAQGRFRAKWEYLRSIQVTLPLLTLSAVILVWSCIGAVFSQPPIQTLKVYSKLLLILMLLTTWGTERWRQLAWKAFVVGMLIVTLSTYANVWIDLPWSRTRNQGFGQDHSVFVDYVSQSLMSVLFLCFCLHRSLTDTNTVHQRLWLFAGVMTLGSVLFLLQARSGLVALLVASTVMVGFYTPRKYLIRVVSALIILGLISVAISPLMRQQLLLGYTEVTQYKPFEVTSLGARIDMWRFALEQSLAHPFLGTGAGTYRELAAQHFGHCTYVCDHPHNQYLFFSMEFGIFGLAAYLWLITRIAKTALTSFNPERALLLVLIAILAVDSLFNVPLWYRGQSYFFFVMLALLLATAGQNSSEHTKPQPPEHL